MESINIQFESNLSRFPVLEAFPSNKVFDLKLWRPAIGNAATIFFEKSYIIEHIILKYNTLNYI